MLADELRAEAPGVWRHRRRPRGSSGWPVERIVQSGSAFHSACGNWVFDLEYSSARALPVTRRLRAGRAPAPRRRADCSLVATPSADVVVSTYPGTTEVARAAAPARAAAGALSSRRSPTSPALRFWAHPGVDLHLVTHPESVEEVRAIAGPRPTSSRSAASTTAGVREPRAAPTARRALGLPADAPVVVVSGGGWGVGDLEGAVRDRARASPAPSAVVLCGPNEALRERLDGAVRPASARVRVLGFTDRMRELLAAADALVHSTAGLTVLEATMRGCPTISYGWGAATSASTTRAYARLGLAAVARDRDASSRADARPRAGRRPGRRTRRSPRCPRPRASSSSPLGRGVARPARPEDVAEAREPARSASAATATSASARPRTAAVQRRALHALAHQRRRERRPG